MAFITLSMPDTASSRYTTQRLVWTRYKLPLSAKPMPTNGLVVLVEREAGRYIQAAGLAISYLSLI